MSGPLGTSGGGAAGVTSVTAGNGITVTGTTTPTIAASLAAGTGIGISGTTTLSISNSGVTSLAGTGVSVSAATGAVTITAPVVAGGTGISVSGSQTTSLTVTNTGVTALAGTGISVSAATGSVTVTPTYAAPTALTIGGTVVTGAAASVANSAHQHAMPGSAVAGASAVGDTAATGSATTVALSDHRHSREAFGTPVALSGAVSAGSATTVTRSDHQHGGAVVFPLGTALLPSIAPASDANTGLWSPTADTLAVSTGGTERMRIDSSGYVGIATTSPGAKLEIAHDGASVWGVVLQLKTTAATDGPRLSFEYYNSGTPKRWNIGIRNSSTAFGIFEDGGIAQGFGTERVTVLAGGNVGIGTTSPNSTLHASGSFSVAIVSITGATTLNATHSVVLCGGTSSYQVTLPTAVGIAGRMYQIKKTSTSGYTLTIGTTSSQTIDGNTSLGFATQYNNFVVISDGANWSLL